MTQIQFSANFTDPARASDISSLLTTAAMQALNKEVQVNGGDPGEVAKAFLSANKIVTS